MFYSSCVVQIWKTAHTKSVVPKSHVRLGVFFRYSVSSGRPALPQMVVKTYMDMDQDSEEEKQQYLGLALHLASEFFLRNPNKDVRLLVACCLADIFRIYAPEAPYTSHDKLKVGKLQLALKR